MELKGFKAFNNDLTNRYGQVFLEGEKYFINGEISFGLMGNGFHFCKRLEDTLRFYDAMNDKIRIAEVIGRGEIVTFEDEYNGYYDMYAASNLEIVKILSRDEIINQYLICRDNNRVKRFVSGFRLTNEEINKMENAHWKREDVLDAIDYYQKNIDVYNLKKVRNIFRNNNN